MLIRINDLRLDLDQDEGQLRHHAAMLLGLQEAQVEIKRLLRKAVDARRNRIQFCYSLEVAVAPRWLDPDRLPATASVRAAAPPSPGLLQPRAPALPAASGAPPAPGQQSQPLGLAANALRPVIVGSGPAGLFCALKLLQHGIRPVIIEQGEPMPERVQSVERFWNGGPLNERSNVQFGEGGAGTFSDGKLTTRIDDPRVEEVLQAFVELGADPEVLYLKKPHVGTEAIRRIVVGIRSYIQSRGGEVYFNTCLTDLKIADGRLLSICLNSGPEQDCPLLVLAAGNSSRALYRLLLARGVQLIPKPFAVGLRIEHPQSGIDRMQYGRFAGHPRLGAADYQFTYKDPASGRGIYTFCMCPGGYVVAAASQKGQVVTNGMSYAARGNHLANSALVAAVTPADWGGSILGGMEMQEHLEKRAFELGGGDYCAPAQCLDDFLKRNASADRLQGPYTYRPGVRPADLWQLFNEDIAKTLQSGILYWGRKAPEFLYRDAVLTGVETRTSAPVRIVRDEQRRCTGIVNLYPCGEGSGYAGGIMSSAVDGIKTAEAIVEATLGG